MDIRLIASIALLVAAGMAGCIEDDGHDHDHHDDGHDHGAHMDDGHDDHMGGDHMHDVYEVPEGQPTPSIKIEAIVDAKSGHNIHIMTTEFTFDPGHASGPNSPGTGHAHIYVDGVKLGRVYGDWYHLDGLEPGEHEVRVNLNANDHSPYSVDGVLVEDTVTITTPAPGEGMGHMHMAHATTDMSVALDVEHDAMGGVNLHVTYEGFTFDPAAASSEHEDGKGHAHIYVDGVKVARLYTDWFHLGLDEGEHEIEVVLNGNDHSPYQVDGQDVAASQTITV